MSCPNGWNPRWTGALALLLVAGCRSYEPRPLEPAEVLASIDAARRVDPSPEVVDLVHFHDAWIGLCLPHSVQGDVPSHAQFGTHAQRKRNILDMLNVRETSHLVPSDSRDVFVVYRDHRTVAVMSGFFEYCQLILFCGEKCSSNGDGTSKCSCHVAYRWSHHV